MGGVSGASVYCVYAAFVQELHSGQTLLGAR